MATLSQIQQDLRQRRQLIESSQQQVEAFDPRTKIIQRELRQPTGLPGMISRKSPQLQQVQRKETQRVKTLAKQEAAQKVQKALELQQKQEAEFQKYLKTDAGKAQWARENLSERDIMKGEEVTRGVATGGKVLSSVVGYKVDTPYGKVVVPLSREAAQEQFEDFKELQIKTLKEQGFDVKTRTGVLMKEGKLTQLGKEVEEKGYYEVIDPKGLIFDDKTKASLVDVPGQKVDTTGWQKLSQIQTDEEKVSFPRYAFAKGLKVPVYELKKTKVGSAIATGLGVVGESFKELKEDVTEFGEKYNLLGKADKAEDFISEKVAQPTFTFLGEYVGKPVVEGTKFTFKTGKQVVGTAIGAAKPIREGNILDEIGKFERDIIGKSKETEWYKTTSPQVIKSVSNLMGKTGVSEVTSYSTLTPRTGKETVYLYGKEEVPLSRFTGKGAVSAYQTAVFGEVIPRGYTKIVRATGFPEKGTRSEVIVDPLTGKKIYTVAPIGPEQVGKAVGVGTELGVYSLGGGLGYTAITGAKVGEAQFFKGKYGGPTSAIEYAKQRPLEVGLAVAFPTYKAIKYFREPIVTQVPRAKPVWVSEKPLQVKGGALTYGRTYRIPRTYQRVDTRFGMLKRSLGFKAPTKLKQVSPTIYYKVSTKAPVTLYKGQRGTGVVVARGPITTQRIVPKTTKFAVRGYKTQPKAFETVVFFAKKKGKITYGGTFTRTGYLRGSARYGKTLTIRTPFGTRGRDLYGGVSGKFGVGRGELTFPIKVSAVQAKKVPFVQRFVATKDVTLLDAPKLKGAIAGDRFFAGKRYAQRIASGGRLDIGEIQIYKGIGRKTPPAVKIVGRKMKPFAPEPKVKTPPKVKTGFKYRGTFKEPPTRLPGPGAFGKMKAEGSLYYGKGTYELTTPEQFGLISRIPAPELGAVPTGVPVSFITKKGDLSYGLLPLTKVRAQEDLIQKPRTDLLPKSEVIPITLSLPRSTPRLRSSQRTSQVLAPRLTTETITVPSLVVPTPAPPTPRPPFPRPPRRPFPKAVPLEETEFIFKKKKKKKLLKEDLFVPFVRRGGKYLAVGKPTRLARARAIGKKVLRRTLAASLQVRTTKGKPVAFRKPTKGFRFAKGKEGRFTLVQRRQKRLKGFGETREIVRIRKGGVKYI